jgi:NADPH2:quinone reductase
VVNCEDISFTQSFSETLKMLPETMTAIEITQAGGPEVLLPTTCAVPQPAAGQVLIKVAYAGINRHDCGQRKRGAPPKGATDIPGLEVAGEVVAVGEGVTRWKPGDKACALVNGGGYAQYCIAHHEVTLPIPAGFDMKHAAGLLEALMTAWQNVFIIGQLKAGEWLLVHGGSSGVGSIAIQLGRLIGAQVVTTAGNAAKCEFCLKIGAQAAINYKAQDFAAEVQKVTGGHGADVILDMAGTAYAKRNLDALARDGRVVHVSSGSADYSVPLSAIMAKRAIISGSGLRSSEHARKVEIVRQLNERVWPHLGNKVKPYIDSVLPLAKACDAHARMETSEHIGKILLEVTH